MAPDECVKFNSSITDAMGVEGDLDPHPDGPLELVTLPQDYIKDLIYLLVPAALQPHVSFRHAVSSASSQRLLPGSGCTRAVRTPVER